MNPPAGWPALQRAVRDEQLRELERLWYQAGDDRSKFARQLMQLVARLGDKYQVDELAAKYEFTGRTPLTVPRRSRSRKNWKRSTGCSSNWKRRPRRPRSASSIWKSCRSSPNPGGRKTRRDAAAGRAITARKWPSNKDWSGPEGLSAYAQGLSPVSGAAAGADFLPTSKRPGPAGIRGRSSAKGRSSCSRPSNTSSATR